MGKTSFAVALLSLSVAGGCSSDGVPATPSLGGASGAMAAGGAGAGGIPGGGAAGMTTTAGAPSGGATSGGAGGASGAAGASAGAPAGGAAGAAGAAGGGAAGGGTAGGAGAGPTSTGCTKTPPGTDSQTAFIKHDIEVTGAIDPAYVTAHPVKAGSTYSYTHRNYFLRLPKNYDPTKPYVLDIGGSGCGGSETVGSEGGYPTLGASQTQSVQVALSYVVNTKEACFADRSANPPDLPFFDAVLADIEAKYCIDKSKIFVHGYSSGAWESYLLGCARANVIRGIGTVQGGERISRPACTGKTAAILVAGLPPNDNPIGPLDPNSAESKELDSLGSGPARDEILARNGCVGTDTETWDAAYPDCKLYKGCPKEFPVVWCAMPTLGHNYATGLAQDGFWKFWSSLPAKP